MDITRISLILGAIFVIPNALAKRDVDVESIFKEYNIDPDIVWMAPEKILQVGYSSTEICPGDEIVQTQSITMPNVTFESKSYVNYTLIMIDADMPSQHTPALRSVLYWLVVNIPGNDNIKAGFTVAPYVPPVVYPGSGWHRFVFLLYSQDKHIDEANPDLLNLAVKRSRFSVSHFADVYGMRKLDAGNFFIMKIAAPTEEFYCKA